MSTLQQLQHVTPMLYPNGRAFRVPEGGDLRKWHDAVNTEFADLDASSMNVLDALLPDNPNFTLADAQEWYRRLGLYDSGSIPLNDMALAITQKMSWPTVTPDMQSLQYIQDQLQAAGFNVYLYKNRFFDGVDWVTMWPSDVLGIAAGNSELEGFNLGQANLGSTWSDDGITICVDYLEEDKDEIFDFGDNLRSTFYVSSAAIGTFADIPAARKIEFRQLLIKLKAAQMAAFLFVNYI